MFLEADAPFPLPDSPLIKYTDESIANHAEWHVREYEVGAKRPAAPPTTSQLPPFLKSPSDMANDQATGVAPAALARAKQT